VSLTVLLLIYCCPHWRKRS